MAEQQSPDWARGVLAVGLLLLIAGFWVSLWLSAVGGLAILFVGVSTAGQRRASGEPPETLLRPGDRPWRRQSDD
jgi:type IV secretory pathway TrbD component